MQLNLPPWSALRWVALTLTAGTIALAVSACGSGASSSTSASAAAATTSSANTAYTARLNYAKCMRAHGVNVPDPSANGGPPAGGAGGIGALRSSPNFASANQACSSYLRKAFGAGGANPAAATQFRQDLVKFAECMRSHSIDIPDPTSSGGGFGIFRTITSAERNSPAFKSAIQACSSTLPRFGRGGAGTTASA